MAGLEADAETACAMVEDAVGAIEQRTVIESVYSTGRYARLTEHATSLTTFGDLVDLTGLRIIAGGVEGAFGAGLINVEYVTGYAPGDVPSWAKTAAKMLTKWLWQSRQPVKQNSATVDLKARADVLLDPHRRGPRP